MTDSSDGGLHWSPATLVYGQTDAYTLGDKPSLTADPSDPRVICAVWDVLNEIDGGDYHKFFARTIDGGQSWEPARPRCTPEQNRADTDANIFSCRPKIETAAADKFTQPFG